MCPVAGALLYTPLQLLFTLSVRSTIMIHQPPTVGSLPFYSVGTQIFRAVGGMLWCCVPD